MIIISLSLLIIQYFIYNFYCQFELKLDLLTDDTIYKHSAILQLLHPPLNGWDIANTAFNTNQSINQSINQLTTSSLHTYNYWPCKNYLRKDLVFYHQDGCSGPFFVYLLETFVKRITVLVQTYVTEHAQLEDSCESVTEHAQLEDSCASSGRSHL